MNRKGAPAFVTTGDPCLDIFTAQRREMGSKEEFVSLIRSMEEAWRTNPKLFLRLMKYKRNTDKGQGHKLLHLMMASVLSRGTHESVFDILAWTKDCHKDLMQMARLGVDEALDTYAGDLVNLLRKIWQGETNLPLLPVKYLSSNGGKFEEETKEIWDRVESNLIWCPLQGEAAETEHAQFLKSLFPGLLTNKKRRLFKSHFDKLLNLIDDVSRMSEEELLHCLTSSSSLATQQLRKKLLKMGTPAATGALRRYAELLKQQETKAKTHGVDLAADAFLFFSEQLREEEIPILQAQLEHHAEEFKKSLDGASLPLEAIVDISGSMSGGPLWNALFHTLMLWHVCELKRVIFFSSDAKLLDLPSGMGIMEKIKFLYRHTEGSTVLDRAIHLLRSLPSPARTIVIFSDGDCDPSPRNQNPFREALQMFPQSSFIVFNLNKEELCFPHTSEEKRVCYLGGSNIKVIGTALEAILKEKKFSPQNVMELALEKLEPPFVPQEIAPPMTEEEVNGLYRKFNRLFRGSKRMNS